VKRLQLTKADTFKQIDCIRSSALLS